MLIDIKRLIAAGLRNLPVGRRKTLSMLSACSFTALAGCAIHPVQQDMTQVPTNYIVRRIRCEARLAILDKAVDMLRKGAEELSQTPPSLMTPKIERQAHRLSSIADQMQRERGGRISKINRSDLPTPESKDFYDRYIKTVIAYDFLFDITEENGASLEADPVRLLSNGMFGFKVGASGGLKRNNLRNFALSDSFGDLLFNQQLECESADYLPDNYAYPLAGSVGLRKAIDTFIDLYEDRALNPLKKPDLTVPAVFADTLQFTTLIKGSIGPHVNADPVEMRWGVAAPTGVGMSASRNDIHTLTIGLAMNTPAEKPDPKTGAASAPVIGLTKAPRARSTQSSNERSAFEAIQQLRLRSFLERAIVR